MALFENALSVAKPLDPSFTVGKKLRTVNAVINTGSTSANGDVYILAKGLPATARIAGIVLPKGSAAVTGLSDVDFGFYASHTSESLDGSGNLVINNTVIDKDALVDGATFASAKGFAIDLLGDGVSSFDPTKSIGELCSLSSQDFPAHGVDVCATLNAVGTATGKIYVNILIAED